MTDECSHDVVYYGAMNIDFQGQTFGSVDVWRCRKCKTLFCEDKRWGQTELAPEVGLPKIVKGAKWTVIVCLGQGPLNWTLKQVKFGTPFEHKCIGGTIHTIVVKENLTAECQGDCGDHKVFLVENFVNKAVEVGA